MQTRQSHRIEESGDLFCSDGFDWMEASERQNWETIGAWGKDGWNLGSWPLVVISWRERGDDLWDVCEHVEGDLYLLEGATVAERDAWIDHKAVWHWLVGQSDGPCQTHVDADGNPTPDNQNWQHRINLCERALREHLARNDRDPEAGKWLGHFQYEIREANLSGGTLYDIHRGLHAETALRQGRTALTDEELVDWMDPNWRGPYGRARAEEARPTSGMTT